ncbi:MAG: DUF559 domain-containing protein [Chloroflexota bacterium]
MPHFTLFQYRQGLQGFIVDFYCHKSALVIEVDGDIHDLQKEEDDPLRPLDCFALPQIPRTWNWGEVG